MELHLRAEVGLPLLHALRLLLRRQLGLELVRHPLCPRLLERGLAVLARRHHLPQA
jgi:hypothetical protein